MTVSENVLRNMAQYFIWRGLLVSGLIDKWGGSPKLDV